MGFFEDDLQGTTTLLESWPPDVGDGWTRLWGTDASTFSLQVVAGGVRCSGNGGNYGIIYTADATYPSADYEAELTFVTTYSTERPFYFGVRCQDQENMYGVRLVLSSGGSNAQLYKKVSGTWSTLGSAVTIADGSVVKVSAVGSAIKLYDDGTPVVEVTDTDISAAGKAWVGHGGGDELVTALDDVRAVVMAHTFSVTEIAAGGTVTFAASATGASSTSDVVEVVATRPLSASITGASTTPDTVVLITTAIFGTAYGEASPTNPEHQASSWATFSDGAGGSPTITGDPDYGLLNLESGNAAHGPVVDFTNQDARIYTLSKNLYGSGSGESITEIRGDTTVFTQDAATPSWETYSAPINRSWRYVQLRLRKA